MDKKNVYRRSVLFEAERFFVRRVRNWGMHPENNPELAEEIRSGKHPGLEILVGEVDSYSRYSRRRKCDCAYPHFLI